MYLLFWSRKLGGFLSYYNCWTGLCILPFLTTSAELSRTAYQPPSWSICFRSFTIVVSLLLSYWFVFISGNRRYRNEKVIKKSGQEERNFSMSHRSTDQRRSSDYLAVTSTCTHATDRKSKIFTYKKWAAIASDGLEWLSKVRLTMA